MNIPKKAIEKAIDGGWRLETPNLQANLYESDEDTDLPEWRLYETDGLREKWLSSAEIALDPSFWQGLGKALGWGKCPFCEHAHEGGYRCGNCDETGILPDLNPYKGSKGGWAYYAKEFYDLILTGGDTEAFWKELLTNNHS